MLRVVEIFYSLQGEGRYCGTPSIFVRFGGCNLSCPGYGCETVSPRDGTVLTGCDTVKAVDAHHFKETWEEYDGAGMIAMFDRFVASAGLGFRPDVVITGGEPTLYFCKESFAAFARHLVAGGYRVTVETNGTILPDFDRFAPLASFVYALAVKLDSSGEQAKRCLNETAIRGIAQRAECFFKFVASAATLADDEIQIARIAAVAPEIAVYCMPMGNTIKVLESNARAVFEMCMRHGWCYSDRIQIRIYNNREGV